jgi:hypothetical protein
MSSEEAKSVTVQESLEKIAALGGVGVPEIERLFEMHRANAMRAPDAGRGALIARMESVRTPATTHLINEAIACMDAGDVASMFRIYEQLRVLLASQPRKSCVSYSSTGSTGHQ